MISVRFIIICHLLGSLLFIIVVNVLTRAIHNEKLSYILFIYNNIIIKIKASVCQIGAMKINIIISRF